MRTTRLGDGNGRWVKVELVGAAETAVVETSWGSWRGMTGARAERLIARLRRGVWR